MTDQEWLDVLFYDFWLPPLITMHEYEILLDLVRQEME